MRAKLTKREVDKQKAEADCLLWIWDTELKGFGLCVRPNGRKTYVIEYRPGLGGRASPKRRYVIGQHGVPWTADTARTEATRILGLVADGEDPAVDKSQSRKVSTVKELGELFIENYAKQRQRRWVETERIFKRSLYPSIGPRRIGEVTRHDIARIIDGLAGRAPTMAKLTLAYVRKFFNWCIERGHIEINPCSKIQTALRSHSRERVLEDAELVEVWNASESAGKNWAKIVKLLALTGQRRSEVVEMRWEEIDFDKKIWTIPGERTKNHRTHEVPLCETAIGLIKNQIQIKNCPFVFTTTGRTPVSGLSKAKQTMDKAILTVRQKAAVDGQEIKTMPHWVYHDLRRTATTGMAKLGIHPHVADAVLNHKEGQIRGVAAVYNRHAYLEDRRRALEAWERYVLDLVSGKDRNRENVVAMTILRNVAA